MERARQFLGYYWVFYYSVFAGFSAYYLWLQWRDLPVGSVAVRIGELIGQYGSLADAFGAAAGIALSSVILIEGILSMALLIPTTIKWIKQENERRRQEMERRREELRKEGLERGLKQGLEQGHAEADAEWRRWLNRRDAAFANNEPFDEPAPSELRQIDLS